MRASRLIRLTALALVVLCLCTGCTSTATGTGVVDAISSTYTDLKNRFMVLIGEVPPDPNEFLTSFVDALERNDFGSAYAMLSDNAKAQIPMTTFAERHQVLFDAIGMTGLSLSLGEIARSNDAYEQKATLTFASEVFGSFTQGVTYVFLYDNAERVFHLEWQPSMLLSNLALTDKLYVNTLRPSRGEILDGEHNKYAVNTYADTVFIRLSDELTAQRETVVANLAALLEMEPKAITDILDSKRAVADGLAQLKAYLPGTLNVSTRQALLSIDGVGVNSTSYTPIRYYPQGTTLSHVLGYASVVTAEDIEQSPGKYDAGTLIGRAGLEAAYDDTLRGENGYALVIYDENGAKKETVTTLPAKDGLDLEISIDLDLQQRAEKLLETLTPENAGSVVVTDPQTGALQALASYPCYDPNDFSYGASEETIAAYYKEEANNPLYNRATQGLYPPGSTIKPLIAAFALDESIMSPTDVFPGTVVEKKWTPQSFGTWFYPAITRVENYEGEMNMSNAITNSDNIYFAYVALKAGWDKLEPYLKNLGFDQKIDFDLRVSTASYMNSVNYDNLRLLADTGYGQGQVVISPLQMALVFGAMANDQRAIMRPRLVVATHRMQGVSYPVVESFDATPWRENVFTASAQKTIRPMLRRVVTEGSGRKAAISGLTVSGKTGTAEIGTAKEREIAWFIAYLEDADYDRLACVTLETPANWENTLRYDLVRELLSP